jgi:hypothetical protein
MNVYRENVTVGASCRLAPTKDFHFWGVAKKGHERLACPRTGETPAPPEYPA